MLQPMGSHAYSIAPVVSIAYGPTKEAAEKGDYLCREKRKTYRGATVRCNGSQIQFTM